MIICEVKKDGKAFLRSAKIAKSFSDRLIGLMFKLPSSNYDGLIIDSCNSIHTCFMKYNIDVIFINKSDQVVKFIKNIKPWRMTLMYFSAARVIEYESGVVHLNIKVGDQLEVVCIK